MWSGACANAPAARGSSSIAAAAPAGATTFTVTNTNDSGAGSLRAEGGETQAADRWLDGIVERWRRLRPHVPLATHIDCGGGAFACNDHTAARGALWMAAMPQFNAFDTGDATAVCVRV